MKTKFLKTILAEENRQKLIIGVLSTLLLVCICITIWVVFFRSEDKVVLTPDYAPPGEDANSQKIPGDSEGKLDVTQGGGGIGIQYAQQVEIDLSDKTAYIQYANPSRSTQNVMLQIVIKGKIVAQSGIVKPGYQIDRVALLDGMEDILLEGVYTDAVFKFLSYDPVTAEKAMVDSEGKITVNVMK